MVCLEPVDGDAGLQEFTEIVFSGDADLDPWILKILTEGLEVLHVAADGPTLGVKIYTGTAGDLEHNNLAVRRGTLCGLLGEMEQRPVN